MRCPDTNQFAGYDDPEAEVDTCDVTDREVSVEYRAWRPCAECGSEAAEYTGTALGHIDHQCPDAFLDAGVADGSLSEDEAKADPEFYVDDPDQLDVEETDGGGRFRKRLFAVTGDVEWTCQRCDDTGTVQVEERGIAASAFEDTGH